MQQSDFYTLVTALSLPCRVTKNSTPASHAWINILPPQFCVQFQGRIAPLTCSRFTAYNLKENGTNEMHGPL